MEAPDAVQVSCTQTYCWQSLLGQLPCSNKLFTGTSIHKQQIQSIQHGSQIH
jgi:hypothetical protein